MPNDSNAPATDTAAQTAQGQPATGDSQNAQQATPPADGQQQGQTAQANADGQQGQAKPAEGDQAGAKADDKPQGAPESYADFTAPEGVALDDAVVTNFKDVAKELGLSQENAQKVIDKLAPTIAERQTQGITDAAARISAEWAEQAAADTELTKGATADAAVNFQENLAVAKRAWETYGTPELQKLLNDSGLGNNPEMIRWAFRVGQTLKPDSQHVSGGTPPAAKDARSFYPNSNLAP